MPLILAAPERLPVSIAATNRDIVSIRSTECPPHSHLDVTALVFASNLQSSFPYFSSFRKDSDPKISSVQNDIGQLGSR